MCKHFVTKYECGVIASEIWELCKDGFINESVSMENCPKKKDAEADKTQVLLNKTCGTKMCRACNTIFGTPGYYSHL